MPAAMEDEGNGAPIVQGEECSISIEYEDDDEYVTLLPDQAEALSDSDDEFLPTGTPQDYISPDGVTFMILENCSAKMTDKLFSSDGYSYGLAKVSKCGTKSWRCVKRSTRQPCMAKVLQKDSQTMELKGRHCHPPDAHDYVVAQITTAVKRKVTKYPHRQVTDVVRTIIGKYLPKGLEDRNSLTVERLAHMANRYKRLTLGIRTKNIGGGISSPETPPKQPFIDLTAPITVSVDTTPGDQDIGLLPIDFEPDRAKKHKHKHKARKAKSLKRSITAIGSLVDDHDKYECVYMPRSLLKKVLKEGASQAVFDDIMNPPAIAKEVEVGNASTAADVTTTVRPSVLSTSDPDDMFFCALAAEVKEMPKLVKSGLKLELLSLVNNALQNQAQSSQG